MIPCQVTLLGVGISEGNAQNWKESSYRINRIHLPLSGAAGYRDIDGPKRLQPGAAYLMINGFTQDLSVFPGTEYKHLYLDFQCAPPLFSGALLEIPREQDPCLFVLLSGAEGLIRREFDEQSGRSVPKDSRVFAELQGMLSVIFSYLYRNYSLPLVKNETIERALTYVRDHFSEPICNTHIAAELHIDNRYLIRLFRRYMGCSPYQYLTQYRVERAMELLRRRKSVNETAFACGYRSEASFRMAFKRITGHSPTGFLKQK